MRGLKDTLTLVGILMLGLGVLLHFCNYPRGGQQHEEIHTVIWEAEQEEDLPEHGADTDAEAGQHAEELPQAAGEEETMTREEEQELEQLATAEAESEGEEGLWLVMSVVMNRVADPQWPDNIHDVIHQSGITKKGKRVYQFSCMGNGRFERSKPSRNSAKALERIKAGDIKKGIVGFERDGSDVLEKWFRYAFTYKHHKFYTKK